MASVDQLLPVDATTAVDEKAKDPEKGMQALSVVGPPVEEQEPVSLIDRIEARLPGNTRMQKWFTVCIAVAISLVASVLIGRSIASKLRGPCPDGMVLADGRRLMNQESNCVEDNQQNHELSRSKEHDSVLKSKSQLVSYAKTISGDADLVSREGQNEEQKEEQKEDHQLEQSYANGGHFSGLGNFQIPEVDAEELNQENYVDTYSSLPGQEHVIQQQLPFDQVQFSNQEVQRRPQKQPSDYVSDQSSSEQAYQTSTNPLFFPSVTQAQITPSSNLLQPDNDRSSFGVQKPLATLIQRQEKPHYDFEDKSQDKSQIISFNLSSDTSLRKGTDSNMNPQNFESLVDPSREDLPTKYFIADQSSGSEAPQEGPRNALVDKLVSRKRPQ